jgi:hypothetical protein
MELDKDEHMSGNFRLITCIINSERVQEVMSAAWRTDATGVMSFPFKKNGIADGKEAIFIMTDCNRIPAIMGALCKLPIFNDPTSSIVCTAPREEDFIPGF